MKPILARELKPGTRIRTEQGFGMVESVELDKTKYVTGGRRKNSAVALKITLHGGAVFFVHPGDELLVA